MYNNSIIDNKLKKNERLKRDFEKIYDKVDGEINYYSSGKYQIKHNKWGVVDFYITNDTIIVRDSKKTVTNGLKWVLKNLTR